MFVLPPAEPVAVVAVAVTFTVIMIMFIKSRVMSPSKRGTAKNENNPKYLSNISLSVYFWVSDEA